MEQLLESMKQLVSDYKKMNDFILEIFNDLLNPDYIFDGELYTHEYKEDFDEISSLIKKTKPTKKDLEESREKIQYWIYDLPSSDGVFSKRLETLKRVLSKVNNKSIVLVETRLINTQKELDDYFDELIETGFEGQIIRFDSNKYENKRTKQLWKRKEFQDEEFKILDICEGKGNRIGMVGYMRFKTKEGKEFTSDLKAKHERLKYVWEHRNEYIGKIAKVKFFKLTPDGLPRFPKVIEIDRQDI
jgi:DNA ligase-1